MIKRKGIKYSIRKYVNLEKNFTQIPNDAFRIIANGNCFIVYCYLCRNYNTEYEYAFPSLKAIEKSTGLTKKTIIKCLTILEEELNLIKKIKFTDKTGKYANNCYKVYFPVIEEEKEIIEVPQLNEEQLKEIEEFENRYLEKIEEEIAVEEETDEE